jgi:hypothetical protein
MTFSTFCIFAQYKEGIKIPVVVITDLYHPYEDPGDNLDLIMGYALPEISLKGILLDITDAFRKKTADFPLLWEDPFGPREAGIIPVMQMNYIFNKQIPFAIGPLSPIRSYTDKMMNIPSFQQGAICLLLKILKESPDSSIQVLSFGSLRILAVAFNRAPDLLKKKIKMIHISAGTAAPDFKMGKDQGANSIPGGEWNVALDVKAFTRILRSNLPIALYPCAGIDGAFVKDTHNTYWQLPTLQCIKKINPALQRYVDFALTKKLQYDFLKAMDTTSVCLINIANYPKPFHFWETALWMNVAKKLLVYKTSSRAYEIIPQSNISANYKIISSFLIPCKFVVRDDGRFTFKKENTSNHFIYYRPDPDKNEKALQEAYPRLLSSFSINNK